MKTLEEHLDAIYARGWRLYDFADAGNGKSRWWCSVYPGALGGHVQGQPVLRADGPTPLAAMRAALALIDADETAALYAGLAPAFQRACDAWR